MTSDRLSDEQLSGLHLPDWRVSPAGLEARYLTSDFTAGLEFVNRIGAVAEAANHHPDIQLGYARVGVVLISHDVGAVSQRDVDLAQEISWIAAQQGIDAETE